MLVPPVTAMTRNGLAVLVTQTNAGIRIGGHSFPVRGRFEQPGRVVKHAYLGISTDVPHSWMADGKFDMPNHHPHPLDLVSVNGQPWPGTQEINVRRPDSPACVHSPESTHQGTAMSKTINGITIASLTETQAAIINHARTYGASNDERKQIKREVFGVVKAKFGIPADMKVSAVTAATDSQNYLILHTGGKKGGPKRAFRLGTDGRWDGGYVSQSDLFPPPAPAMQDQTASTAGDNQSSVFGGSPAGNWFRLDPAAVAAVLTASDLDDVFVDGDYISRVSTGDAGVALPTPHLMLAGRDDLAITADGSIYRKL